MKSVSSIVMKIVTIAAIILFLFVRVMSGFLYHSQVPTPSSEASWIKDVNYEPCQADPRAGGLQHIAQMMTLTQSSYMYERLVKIERLCRDLVDKYKKTNHSTFDTVLQTARRQDFYDGLKLEAARAILAGRNGDILRMGINAIQESKAFNISRRIFTSDFPIGDLQKFDDSCTDLFNFLMAPHIDVKNPFFSCVNVSVAVNNARDALYIPFDHTANNHVTSDYLPSDVRSLYMARLESDPILSPVLSLVRSILSGEEMIMPEAPQLSQPAIAVSTHVGLIDWCQSSLWFVRVCCRLLV